MKRNELIKHLTCANISTVRLSFNESDETLELTPEELVKFLNRLGNCEHDKDAVMGSSAAAIPTNEQYRVITQAAKPSRAEYRTLAVIDRSVDGRLSADLDAEGFPEIARRIRAVVLPRRLETIYAAQS